MTDSQMGHNSFSCVLSKLAERITNFERLHLWRNDPHTIRLQTREGEGRDVEREKGGGGQANVRMCDIEFHMCDMTHSRVRHDSLIRGA